MSAGEGPGGYCPRLPPGGPHPDHTAARVVRGAEIGTGYPETTQEQAAQTSVMALQSSVPSKATVKFLREKIPIFCHL